MFQIPGFKKPSGNLTGTIKNVSLRAAACHKQTTRQGHKNPVPATPLPVALRLLPSACEIVGGGRDPPTWVCVHMCMQVDMHGGGAVS